MKPTEKQIRLYKKLREIARQHHEYSDQMMAIAMFIDAEFKQKNEANEVNSENSNCNIPHVRNRRELLLAFLSWYKTYRLEKFNVEQMNRIIEQFEKANNCC